ncbi:YggS family pyridoxal phosphate-dependent enzyme [Clostridium merdae]|uniref:YggS family pyridoxal phosphate-dependent enzyme n=1 Tax=Clostridium merdae TaxID=1958780 RepID=UPI000A26D752|nr:YggS family pyridoxal phosphate-dependent enzyme [Clostridium merdae]
MMEKSLSETEQDYAEKMRDLEENLKVVRENIEEAAVKSGRSASEITLLAATKTVAVPVINRAVELGVTHIGENRVQELCDKLPSLAPCDRQFIGHLQSNKIKFLIGQVSLIQSVDNEKLAKEISRLSVTNGTVTNVLVEVNVGHEENKSGIVPEQLEELMVNISSLPGVLVRGLMAIPPVCENPEDSMPYFSRMQQYYVDIKAKRMDNIHMDFLSMGMSSDYAQAILCGANMVRVGSALFGPRKYQIL